MTLDQTPLGAVAKVQGVDAPAGQPELAQALRDLGFEPGETVRVLKRGAWGAETLVVRVGNSTYALRRAEAACVVLVPGA